MLTVAVVFSPCCCCCCCFDFFPHNFFLPLRLVCRLRCFSKFFQPFCRFRSDLLKSHVDYHSVFFSKRIILTFNTLEPGLDCDQQHPAVRIKGAGVSSRNVLALTKNLPLYTCVQTSPSPAFRPGLHKIHSYFQICLIPGRSK